MKTSNLQLLTSVGKRYFYISKRSQLFFEDNSEKKKWQIQSDDEERWNKLSFFKKLMIKLKLRKVEFNECTSNVMKDLIQGPRLFVYDHEVDVIWKFTGDKKELSEWVISTDKDFNIGFSTAQLEYTSGSKGKFHGFLDTKLPSDGKHKKVGFCNLRTVAKLNPRNNIIPYDWQDFNHLVLHLRGDGRVYSINLHMERKFDVCMYDTYHYFIWTRGGPYWQHVRIPFSKFFFGYKGRIQSQSRTMQLNDIKFISFTIADKITGPFQLEIDYIGVENDPSHIEQNAYEQYQVKEVIL